MNRLSAGILAPACYFLPPVVAGHPTSPCLYGTPGNGDLAKARVLVKRSGMVGTPVTVWSETLDPLRRWMAPEGLHRRVRLPQVRQVHVFARELQPSGVPSAVRLGLQHAAIR